jgi:hypothetical protein
MGTPGSPQRLSGPLVLKEALGAALPASFTEGHLTASGSGTPKRSQHLTETSGKTSTDAGVRIACINQLKLQAIVDCAAQHWAGLTQMPARGPGCTHPPCQAFGLPWRFAGRPAEIVAKLFVRGDRNRSQALRSSTPPPQGQGRAHRPKSPHVGLTSVGPSRPKSRPVDAIFVGCGVRSFRSINPPPRLASAFGRRPSPCH